MTITRITTPAFLDNIINFSTPLLIKFFAPWCDDCQNIAPLYHKLSINFASQIQFAELDIDTHALRDYYKSMGIVEIPSFVVYYSRDQHYMKRGDDALEEFISDVASKNFEELRDKWSQRYAQKVAEQTPEHAQYDLVVIGGGSGGIACARQAAKFTRGRVAVVDWVDESARGNAWDLGGTCVNVGCVPKFLYHRAANVGELLKEHAGYYGWGEESTARTHDWGKMQESVQLHIKKLNWKYERALRESKVEYIHGRAHFDDARTVTITYTDGTTQTIQAKHYVIVTGGRPQYPVEIEGAEEHCITSDDVFFLREAPGKTLVVGGSYIAVETAGFLAALGHGEVTLSVRSKMLRNFDEECVGKVETSLRHVGVNISYGQLVTKVEAAENGFKKVTFGNGQSETFKTVFVATGRTPNTKSLNLKGAQVNTNSQGFITVNDYNETSTPNIYALGDVIENAPELTPVAILAGKMVAQRLFLNKTNTERFVGTGDVTKEIVAKGESDKDKKSLANVLRSSKKSALNFVPTTVFSPNEYSSVGLTEHEARQVYGAEHIRVYRKTVRVLENELHPDHPHDAFGKLICLKNEDERVVGFHFVGPKAGEVCQGMALALRLGARKQDFDYTVGIHPTVAEMFCSLEYGVEEDVGCGCG